MQLWLENKQKFYFMETLNYILKKFNIKFDDSVRMPIEIPNFGRDGLAQLFHELNFKLGAEIGVCKGEFSEVICKANPQAKLFSIDPWTPYKEYTDYQKESTFNKLYTAAKERLDKYPNCLMIQDTGVNASKKFADNSLDFVYIDANHKVEFVMEDVATWIKKIRPGGILAGHDYAKIRKPTSTHVYEAINAYTQSYVIRPWFLIGQNAMIPGEVRDSMRSWMWVKI